MKSCTRSLRTLLFLGWAASCLSGPRLIAQEPDRDLNDLAKGVSKELTRVKIGSVVVADFVGQDGASSIEGHYLANEFSQRLEHYAKRFEVIERKQLSSALSDAQLSANDLAAVNTLRRIGGSLKANAIVTGILETTPKLYTVRVGVRRVQDGSVVASGEQSVKRPAYVDTLMFLDPTGSATEVARAGEHGVSVPTCVNCPPPNYTAEERAAKVQGAVVLEAVVNVNGRVGRISVVRAIDDGLARRAVEVVHEWQFKPATDKDGKPVPVLVPIYVTFRLY